MQGSNETRRGRCLRVGALVGLSPALVLASLWCLWVMVAGLEGLDGASGWDGYCFKTDVIESVIFVAAGGSALGGLWCAFVAWACRLGLWRHGLAATALGVALYVGGAAVSGGATVYLSIERCYQ